MEAETSTAMTAWAKVPCASITSVPHWGPASATNKKNNARNNNTPRQRVAGRSPAVNLAYACGPNKAWIRRFLSLSPSQAASPAASRAGIKYSKKIGFANNSILRHLDKKQFF